VASGQVELSSAAEQALLRLLPRLISGGVLASPSPFEGQGRAGVDDVRLIEPDVSCRDEFIAYCEEFKAAGEPFAHDQLPDAEADFAGLVRRWFQWSRGINLKPGWVPGSTYWLVRGRRILGTARLRHTLNDDLLKEGGNIGYEVRPTERGKGCATRLLSLMLDKARQLGLARVLLTCVKENIASARVMHKNGGVLEDEIPSRIHPGGTAQRYWIEL
jgi:predicted acetyltransferase